MAMASCEAPALVLVLLPCFFVILPSLLIFWDTTNSGNKGIFLLKNSALLDGQHMKDGAGQDTTQRVNISHFHHWTASGGNLLLSASYSATLQLDKVHLLTSPFISDGDRLWIFLHCWAAEAGKGSSSSSCRCFGMLNVLNHLPREVTDTSSFPTF